MNRHTYEYEAIAERDEITARDYARAYERAGEILGRDGVTAFVRNTNNANILRRWIHGTCPTGGNLLVNIANAASSYARRDYHGWVNRRTCEMAETILEIGGDDAYRTLRDQVAQDIVDGVYE